MIDTGKGFWRDCVSGHKWTTLILRDIPGGHRLSICCTGNFILWDFFEREKMDSFQFVFVVLSINNKQGLVGVYDSDEKADKAKDDWKRDYGTECYKIKTVVE